jgi:hypothetical protein
MKKNCSIALIVIVSLILYVTAYAAEKRVGSPVITDYTVKICPVDSEVYPENANFCGKHGVKLISKKEYDQKRFKIYKNGTVLDTRTNLMWAAKDNGSDINWQDAKSYCENYRGGGYSDWRMPTQDELAGLYDSSKSYPLPQSDYHVRLTELISPS